MPHMLYSTLMLLASVMQPAVMEPWQDPEIVQENRMPMRTTFVTDQESRVDLNGYWKFHFSEDVDTRIKGFEALSYDDGSWGEIPVPGLWELNGYGVPVYVNVGYAWRGLYKNNPPFVPKEGNYVGQYRRVFEIPADWKGKQVCLYIGSATSNVRVWVNGKSIGYSEDSKLEARFDITKAVKPGKNLIALEIFRWCDGTYLEDQDFWSFSGLARDTYVYTREKARLEDVGVVADMDGHLRVNALVSKGISAVRYELHDDGGNIVAKGMSSAINGAAVYETTVPDVNLWSAELPNLYSLKVEALANGKVSESTTINVGFRTVRIAGNQLLVNGQPVLIKGVNRHEISPYKGYLVTEEDMVRDIAVMKSLNINAVRTCHYPDDPLWLSLCDIHGLYVVDEGNIETHGMGYGKETLAADRRFAKAHLERDSRLVRRDRNHPSVIIWSLGNEAGSGANFVDCYNWIKNEDPTRPVQYENPVHNMNKKFLHITDIICPMYWSPDNCRNYLEKDGSKPLIQCEYAHAMGNSVGNFKEYWDMVRSYPGYQGGFIWDFQDQALWNGKFWAFGGDYNPGGPSDGSFNCNGIVAADRSFHPHAYEVRYQYQDIWTSGTPSALNVHNEFFFRDLSDVMLEWNIEKDGKKVLSGSVPVLDVKPQESSTIDLGIKDLPEEGVVTLNVEYLLKREWPLLPAGSRIAYSQIVLNDSHSMPAYTDEGEIGLTESKKSIVLDGECASGRWNVSIEKATGALESYIVDGEQLLSSSLLPCFNRAPTENDLGANLHAKYSLWRKPSFIAESVTVSRNERGYLVKTIFQPIGGIVPLTLSYEVHPDGSILVEEHMDAVPKAPDMFRFGLGFAMPSSYSELDFFGLGPWENYSDRASAAILGRYRQKVSEQYDMTYARTQEAGNHTGLRYFRILNRKGEGLELVSEGEFSASALPYSIEDLDVAAPEGDSQKNNANNQKGIPRHSMELVPSDCTWIHADLVQMGVGGVNSWRDKPLEKYLIHPTERTFRLLIRPVK